jgi:hypothetical protein
MHRLSLPEFERRFPRRPSAAVIDGIVTEPVHIEQDTTITGLVEAPVVVRSGAQVVVTGLVDGPVHVEEDAVLWVHGLVDGRIRVEGAAYLAATSSASGPSSAYVYDPCEPPDSDVRVDTHWAR